MNPWSMIQTFRRYRGLRVITCPETAEPEAVTVDAVHAATSDTLRLSDCSRWPERADCDQWCLREIAASPEGCLVRTIVSSWYEGKSCASCGRAIGPIVWHEAPPAVRASDGTTREWKDIAPRELPHIFRTQEPICWYCNNVAELTRMHPELVLRRERPPLQPAMPLHGDGIY